MSGIIYADFRVLQDARYRVRGIGQHLTALLRARAKSAFSDWKMVGLLDAGWSLLHQGWPELPPECAALVEEVSYSVNPCIRDGPAIFIDGTPMTHDPLFGLRFQNHPAFFRTAVVYDFIPLDWPGYLPTVESRIYYLAKLARLRAFDLFCPISQYTAWRVSELLGVSRSRIQVTGASVRQPVYELRQRLGIVPSPYDKKEPYFVMVTASDSRKNPEVAVQAVRRLNLLYGRRVPLKITGHYDYSDAYKLSLFQLAGHSEGAGFLEFHPGVPDEELVSLLAGAIATIVPSHIEGFSLPVVEAAVCGCPAVASTCAAHLELIDQADALFPSSDFGALAERLEALLNDPDRRNRLVASQAPLGAKFHEDLVGKRFWQALEDAPIDGRRPAVAIHTRKKPKLAFLSPYPPDRSGVARFTAMTMQAGAKFFDLDLYTDAARPLTFEGRFRDAGPVSVAPLVNGRYDAVISVIGNSTYHTRIFEFFEQYGGPCILHDARLTHIYSSRLGQEGFLKLAAKLLGRPATMDEVELWLRDRNLPTLFLEPVVERAAPLIVHTATQQVEIKKRLGVDAHVTTCCPTMFFRDDELNAAERHAARERVGVSEGSFVISSFGIVDPIKATEACIVAVELLRSWNIPAELNFVGRVGPHEAEIIRISSSFGIGKYVRCFADFVDEATYRDFLIATDSAVQLRHYGFGQFSAALTDCISAGLPCVANNDLAKSCDAPPYVLTVPDQFSPLQIAEQLALIWEARNENFSNGDARATYLETHNFEFYCKRLLEILELR